MENRKNRGEIENKIEEIGKRKMKNRVENTENKREAKESREKIEIIGEILRNEKIVVIWKK